ncbi:MAG: aspartate kinase, partial [Saprospiraceae bacterium]
MKVFKFGGASVKDADAIRNVAKIIDSYSPEQLFIVVSAMGKITNALEDVIKSYFYKRDDLNTHWQIVKDYHFSIIKDLFSESHSVYDKVNALFSITEKRFEQAVTESFDCVYDQIVSTG